MKLKHLALLKLLFALAIFSVCTTVFSEKILVNDYKTGTYEMKHSEGSANQISVRLQKGGLSVYVEIIGTYPYKINGEWMANTGTASGYASVEGKYATFTPESSPECRIVIEFIKNGLKVEQKSDMYNCGFGLNVDVSGKYRKISNEPDFTEEDLSTEDTDDKPLPSETSQNEITVKFSRGKSSKTVRGRIKGYETVDYILDAGADQTINIDLVSKNKSLYFVVFDEEGNKLGDSNGQKELTSKLPISGNYAVRVFMPRAQARRGETGNYSISFEIR